MTSYIKPPRRLIAAVTAGVTLITATAVSATSASSPDPPLEPRKEGSAGVSGEAAIEVGHVQTAPVGPTLPGIDVSHWQGDIDWSKVAATGRRFAFVKATDGNDFVDPMFSANVAGARSNGLRVGAYHFARPDPSKGDPKREARHFVRTAGPGPGHLLPVLDVETQRSLDQQGVVRWIRNWVAEVRELTGVTPMVYTSPYGWMNRTGDSPLVARDGAPLWVAHWGVSSPTVPANNWEGQGWRVWQHTSDGSVWGISGRVDLDKAAGTTLGRLTIRRLSVAVDGDAGRVTSVPTGRGCRTICEHSVDPNATVELTAVPDESAYFKAWTGDCSGTEPTCTIEMKGNRSVRASFVTDITPPGVAIDVPSGFLDPAVVVFDEPVRGVTTSNVLVRSRGGARLDTSPRCRSASGPTPCDSKNIRSVRLWPVEPLVPGKDYVAVVNPEGVTPAVKDRVGNGALNTRVPFEGSRAVEQTAAALQKRPDSAWLRMNTTRASDGSFIVSGARGAAVMLRFDGTGVAWTTITGPNRGRADVFVDAARVRTIDLYSPTRSFGVVRRIDGLDDGPHLLRIVVSGRSRPASAGDLIAVDRFDVIG
jgi:GH25 family lysozyme M1 (1,4-beta-N-acetylmuramidase)